jgi:NADP-dependent 3-hydroxy acid dehydrogenase YdfG
MVALDVVKASNATLPKELPPGIVGVFVGGTSGIGEATLKVLAKQAVQPKIYIIGRSAEAAARIIAECRILNADGEYIFIQKSLTLLKDVEALCEEIKQREKYVNILCLSVGEPDVSLESRF